MVVLNRVRLGTVSDAENAVLMPLAQFMGTKEVLLHRPQGPRTYFAYAFTRETAQESAQEPQVTVTSHDSLANLSVEDGE